MGKKFKFGKKHVAVMITIIVFIVISFLHIIGVFNFLEYMSYDLRVRVMAEYTRPSDDIILILLTQDCLDWAQRERGWGWPWPRLAYAEIVDYMNLGNAKGIAFDIIFSEPSVFRHPRQDEIIDNMIRDLEEAQSILTEGTRREAGPLMMNIISNLHSLYAREDDAAFARSMKEYGRVVQTVFFSTQTGSAEYWPQDLNVPLFEPVNFGNTLMHFKFGENMGAQFPIPEIRNAAGALGSVTGQPDSDGIIRRLKPFTYFDGKAVPGLAAALLMVAGMECLYDDGLQIHFDNRRNLLQWGSFTIPLDRNGNALLRFRGELARYHPYRAMDIFKSIEALERGEYPLLPPYNFEDAFVFFGFFAPGLFDIFASPISSLYPGVGCHVTMLDNILQGDFIRESSRFFNFSFLFVIIAFVVLLTLFSHRITVSVSGTILAIIIITAVSFGAYHWGVWLPMITYFAGILAAFISVTLYNYATEGSQKRFIKSAFSQYLSPKVIEQIIHDPSQLKLGGEKREMTAIFTDVKGFSTIAEALGDPAKLVELLNFYLTRMSNIILDNQGTIDKYEGDAIIAFFGAPVYFDNHASLACRSVVMMKKAEAEINKEAMSNGLLTSEVIEALAAKGVISGINDPFPLFTRIGMNTGDMVVGNMGTPSKMDYTIMGNAVNLAARLEGVNKQYNTGGILISEYTRKHLGDEFVLRPLSRVRVVGINTPLRLYELLDISSEASPELLVMVKNWKQGFKLYENRDFQAARDIFGSIYGKNSADLAAKMYFDRCVKYLASPPDEKIWDNGVDNLTQK